MRLRINWPNDFPVSLIENKTNDSDKKQSEDFLVTVYEQCNLVYTTFVNVRFQILSLFISNAALFYFIYSQETITSTLVVFVSMVAIFLTWIIFFIDQRNRHIFRRAVRISSHIEAHFNIPLDMRLHTKTTVDLKNKISHSIIFVVLTISFTLFWISFAITHNVFITNLYSE